MIEVELPDGSIAEFPDGTPDETITSVLQKQFGAPEQRGSILDPLMQGLVPFADEIAGVIGGGIHMARGAGSFGEGYNMTRNRANENYEAFKSRNPKTAMAAEVAGAIPGAMLPIGTVARGASLAEKAGRGALIGAGYGAAYGAGQGEGIGNRVWEGGKGALIGAGVGAAVPVAGRAVSKGVGKLKQALGRPQIGTRAGNMVLDDLAAEGLSIDDAARQARSLGPQGMLADSSPTLRLRAEQIAQSDNPARSGVIRSLQGRSGGAEQRIGSAFDQSLGQRPDVFATLDNMKRTRQANARPLYERAYQRPIKITGQLEMFLQTPTGKVASERARALALDENFFLDPKPMNTRGWNYIKQALDDMIDASMEADSFGRTKATNKTRILTNMKNRILDEIDAQNPLFKQARQQFSDDLSVEKAFNRGMEIFRAKTHPDFFKREIANMSEAEKDAVKLGVRAAVDEAMGRVRNGALKGRQLLDADFNERKIISVLGDREGRQLINSLQAEQAMAETANQALGNSATARRLDNPFKTRGTGMTPDQRGVLRNAFNFQFGDAGASLADKVLRVIEQRGTRNLAQEMGPLLTAQGRNRDKLIRALMAFDQARSQGRTQSESVEALVNALVGTGGRAAVPTLIPAAP